MLGLCLARRKKTKSTDNSETETAWRQLHNTPSGRKSRSKILSSCPIFLYAHMWGRFSFSYQLLWLSPHHPTRNCVPGRLLMCKLSGMAIPGVRGTYQYNIRRPPPHGMCVVCVFTSCIILYHAASLSLRSSITSGRRHVSSTCSLSGRAKNFEHTVPTTPVLGSRKGMTSP